MEKRYDVLTIGLQVIDMVITSVDPSIFSREVTVVEGVQMLLGGDALNQALTAGRLGARTALMGTVGSDTLGALLREEVGRCPVTHIVREVPGSTTISAVLIDRKTRDRRFLYNAGHNDLLGWEHLDQEALRSARVVSVGGAMALPALDGEGLAKALRTAKEAGAVTAMDFTSSGYAGDREKVRLAFPATDYLLPSESEASYLSGESSDPAKMAAALHRMGARNCVIKLGSRGCYVSAGAIRQLVPACPCRCVDTTGAGDAFAGAFLYGLSRGWDVLHCARFANAAGSIAVEHTGANQAIQNLEQVLERMGGASPAGSR